MLQQNTSRQADWPESRRQYELKKKSIAHPDSAAPECRPVRPAFQNVGKTASQPGSSGVWQETARTPHAGTGVVCEQLEQLTRRLNAARAEIRRFQTKLFAYERQMIALRQENAELEAACEQAKAETQLAREQTQQALQQLQALQQAAQPQQEVPAEPEKTACAPAADAAVDVQPEEQPQTEPAVQPWRPQTELEHLSVELISWFDRMMQH